MGFVLYVQPRGLLLSPLPFSTIELFTFFYSLSLGAVRLKKFRLFIGPYSGHPPSRHT